MCVMGTLVDLSGQVFGKLTVVARAGGGGKGKAASWTCRCECGQTTVASRSNLRNGRTASCGCAEGGRTHGRTASREYSSWRGMKNRCLNPNTTGYENWGGRGITVDPRWAASFEAFFKDMGERPAGHSLDRINPDGNYEPGNCRWATRHTQRVNRRANITG